MHVHILLAALSLSSIVGAYQHIPAPIQALLVTLFCTGLVKYIALIPGPTQRLFVFLDAAIGHIKSPIVKTLLQRLDDMIKTQVLALEQTAIAAIQSRLVNGTLPPDQLPMALAQVKADAVSRVKQYATIAGILGLLQHLAFGGDANALSNFISDRIEAHVGALPQNSLKATVAAMSAKVAPASLKSPPVPSAA